MDTDADLRREFASAMKRRGITAKIRDASVERIEGFLEELQARGEITLRRHDGKVILIWSRNE